ncbi:zinc ribbon domain-containing protein [Bradyrhizobium sp. S3.3.6]
MLPGLLRCGHCGRKLHVSYSGKLGRYSATALAQITARRAASRSAA